MDTIHSFHDEIRRVILTRQHPVSGLLPASTAVNQHGDYTDAWVRDNVYSVLAVWGLALAYRRHDDAFGRGVELEHDTVRLMRGLLRSMMRQCDKVEAFKRSQAPADALHAKFATDSGDIVVGDDAWGHLQLDATSLWLLMLAQMTASGLAIVQARSEVRFVQNLVYYVARSYRTPDYGIWERGDKTNHGLPEVNASSVGMAKAALEALAGLNLYGPRGGQSSVIHVQPDDIARARVTLEAMLPRESASKEVDAALLSIVGFPAFAIDDAALASHTRGTVVERLRGRYGLKRFLRDGHQTALEDPGRLHYEPVELERFAHIEAEWPLFEAYLALDAAFRGERAEADAHLARLADLAVMVDGQALLPELYLVPVERIEAERREPGSQPREPGENVPLVWAQSLWLLARMLHEGVLRPADLDPLGRHRFALTRSRPVVQLAFLAQDAAAAAAYGERGIRAELSEDLEPLRVRRSATLARAFREVGRSPELGLSGRPPRRLQSLATSRAYRLQGERFVFLPALFDQQEFYLSLDPATLVARLRAEIAYLHRHWTLLGRPTMTILLGVEHLEHGREAFETFLAEARAGRVGDVPVRLGRLGELLLVTNEERIDDLGDWRDDGEPLLAPRAAVRRLPPATPNGVLHPDAALEIEREGDVGVLAERLVGSNDLAEQVELLAALQRHAGSEHRVGALGASVGTLLEDVYAAAGEARAWTLVRHAAGLLGKVDPFLSDGLSDLLAAQRRVVVGRSYAEGATVTRPLPSDELLATIDRYCRDDPRDRVLTQEMIVALASLVRGEPELFRGILTLRVGHLIHLLAVGLAEEQGATPDEGYERLMRCSPAAVVARLRRVLAAFDAAREAQRRTETLRVAKGVASLPDAAAALRASGTEDEPTPDGWWRWRQREGALLRVPKGFYARVWDLLEHADALVIGDKLDRRNRLDSAVERAATTAGERTFAQRVEHLLHRVPAAEYRHLSVEALETLAALTEAAPDLRVEGDLVLDVIIGHAVRQAWLARHVGAPDAAGGTVGTVPTTAEPATAEPADDASGAAAQGAYERDTAAAWAAFYDLGPRAVAGHLAAAVRYLVLEGSRPRSTTSVH